MDTERRTLHQESPGDAIVLAVIRGGTPERAVPGIDFDGGDRAGIVGFEFQLVTFANELVAHPLRYRGGERHPAGNGFVGTERIAQLVAGDVGPFGRFLRGHAEFDDVQEELQQVLFLRVAPLHGEREIGFALFQGHGRRERGARSLAG